MLIKEIMNKAVSIDKDISVKEAAKIMTQNKIGSLIFTDGEEIIGILTEKDITKNIDNPQKKVSSVMSKEVITIDSESELEEAAELMAKNKIKRLPVTENGKLIGIVTSTELIANSEDLDEDFFL